MFTGLVQFLGTLHEMRDEPPGKRLLLDAGGLAARSAVGDSVAVNGCCLTVVEVQGRILGFDAGPETLARTNLGLLQPGDAVNLESSLRVGDALGGHFVTGHVDAVGFVRQRHDMGGWSDFWFSVPPALTRQMAPKGSVAVDGVSLTLVEVAGDAFRVQLIPHTLSVTTLGRRAVGDAVNIETDLLAKYVQRAAAAWAAE